MRKRFDVFVRHLKFRRAMTGGPPASKNARAEIVRSELAGLRGDSLKSAWHLRRALEICPEYPDALIRLGEYWQGRGHLDLASHYFRKAMSLDPSDPGTVGIPRFAASTADQSLRLRV